MANTAENSNVQDRYWAYTHDEEGQLIDSIGYFDDLNPAITQGCEEIANMVTDDMMTSAVRVVDNNNDSTTVWYAGPIAWVREEGRSDD